MKSLANQTNTSTTQWLPNRKMRRYYNKQNKTNLKLQDFALAKAINDIQEGKDVSWLSKYVSTDMLPHKDNWDLFPNGTRVKLNTTQILSRPPKYLSEEFSKWVQDNAEEDFVIRRPESEEENKLNKGLVPLGYVDAEKDTDESRTWLFDIYTDLLVWSEADQSYVSPQRIEDATNAFADVEQSLTMIDTFAGQLPEETPWTKIEAIKAAVSGHKDGTAQIMDPIVWQDYDSQLQAILDTVKPTESDDSEDEEESQHNEIDAKSDEKETKSNETTSESESNTETISTPSDAEN